MADAGLLSKENIRDLEEGGYEYILGARIRSQSEEFKEQIAELELSNGQSTSIQLTKTRRMVVAMSDARARKNTADREKCFKRLEKRFKSDKLTKDKLNNRGYNRFLSMSGDATIKIDYDKVAESHITLDRARFLAEKIYQIDYVNPYDAKHKSVLLHTREEPEVTELLDIITKNC